MPGSQAASEQVVRERSGEAEPLTIAALKARHFRLGWSLLCAFIAFGVLLDAMHAFKIGLYLDVGAETRRFMWTLAHAHGLGLSLLHIANGATLHAGMFAEVTARLQRGSTCITWASILIPTGFFLGGIMTQGADPSVGVLAVPIGGLVLLAGVVMIAAELRRGTTTGPRR